MSSQKPKAKEKGDPDIGFDPTSGYDPVPYDHARASTIGESSRTNTSSLSTASASTPSMHQWIHSNSVHLFDSHTSSYNVQASSSNSTYAPSGYQYGIGSNITTLGTHITPLQNWNNMLSAQESSFMSMNSQDTEFGADNEERGDRPRPPKPPPKNP